MRGGLAVFIVQVRYWRRHRIQVFLCFLGIVVGVAVYIAIQLATDGALAAFSEGARILSGHATHRIVDASGEGVPEELLLDLREMPAVREAAPFLKARVRIRGRNITILGIDPFSDLAFREFRYRAEASDAPSSEPGSSSPGAGSLLERFVAEPGAVLLSRALAAALGVQVEDTISANMAAGQANFHIIGIFDLPPGRSAAIKSTMLTDIGTHQETFGKLGRLDRIDLILEKGAIHGIEAWLPEPLVIETAGRNVERVETMSRAFRLNLQALGLFALLVAVFLIFNAATFSTVQRSAQTAVLRCIGVSRWQIVRALLGEAAILGIVGGVLGIVLGRWLGARLVGNTGETMFKVILNVEAPESAVTLDARTWGVGLLLSLGAAFAGMIWPAIVSARIPPMASLRAASTREQPRAFWIWTIAGGVICILLTLVLTLPGNGSVLAGIGGATTLALAGALFCPLALLLVSRSLAMPLGRLMGPAGRMAARNLPRAGLSTASLMVALALALSIEVTVNSFRSTFTLWMEQAVEADFYVSPAAMETDPRAAFSRQQIDRLRELPFVRDVAGLQSRRVLLGQRKVWVVAVTTDIFFRTGSLPMSQADPETVAADLEQGSVLVSETLARPLGLSRGSILSLPTPGGMRRFPVAAVVQNYSVPAGIVYLARTRYRALYGNDPIQTVGIWLKPGTNLDMAQAAIESGPEGALLDLQPNAEIRAEALKVFDRTFAITDMLAGLAGFAAFIAVISALMALLEERMRLIGYLRAMGMSARRVGLSMAVEGVLMAFTAAVMSWIVGLLMSTVLVFVVNPRAFGWTMQFHPEQGSYGLLLLVALAAALLGSLYPIRRATRLSISATIREE